MRQTGMAILEELLPRPPSTATGCEGPDSRPARCHHTPHLCGGPGPPGKEGHGAQAAWQPTRSGPKATRGPLRPAPARGRACPFPGTPAEPACPQPELEQGPGTGSAGQPSGSASPFVRGGPPEGPLWRRRPAQWPLDCRPGPRLLGGHEGAHTSRQGPEGRPRFGTRFHTTYQTVRNLALPGACPHVPEARQPPLLLQETPEGRTRWQETTATFRGFQTREL